MSSSNECPGSLHSELNEEQKIMKAKEKEGKIDRNQWNWKQENKINDKKTQLFGKVKSSQSHSKIVKAKIRHK